MKLNNESKQKLRKEIEIMLKDVPEGKRIKLDKELLEDLIFANQWYEEYNQSAKYIVWHGDFLSKIDLSEVSFENVEWDIENYYAKNNDKFNYYEGVEQINLSNTNINVDFSKSFQAKISGTIDIFGINFSNIDMSNCNMEDARIIQNTNFAGTNIRFVSGKNKNNSFVSFFGCDLTGVDLSLFSICGENLFEENYDDCNVFFDCNLKNTGLNIKFNKEDDYFNVGAPAYINFLSMLNTGKLEGCYVNSNLVNKLNPKTKEEIEEQKEKILKSYEEFEKSTFDSVISSIEEQKKKYR